MYVGMLRITPPEKAASYRNTRRVILGFNDFLANTDRSDMEFFDGAHWEKKGTTYTKHEPIVLVPVVDDKGSPGAIMAPDLSRHSFAFFAKDFKTLWRGFASMKEQARILRSGQGGQNIGFFTREYKSGGNAAKSFFQSPFAKTEKKMAGARSNLASKGVYVVVAAADHVKLVTGVAIIHQDRIDLGALQALSATERKRPSVFVRQGGEERLGGIFN